MSMSSNKIAVFQAELAKQRDTHRNDVLAAHLSLLSEPIPSLCVAGSLRACLDIRCRQCFVGARRQSSPE